MKRHEFVVDSQKVLEPTTHFWEAVGCDSIFPEVLNEHGAYLFARNARFGTIKYLRNHHVLSSLQRAGGPQMGGNVYSEDENGNPVYDFAYINSIYAKCVENGIKPVVEMDYMPEALARRREMPAPRSGETYERCSYPADWDKWRALLVAFTQNLIDTFGAEEVRTWYFEVWNEPDLCLLVPFLQQWPVQDWEQFMKLYDVFVDAVTSVDDKLRVGGPGGCAQAFMLRFFEHVCRGKNYVTGKIGTRIDFVSYHYYGINGFDMGEYPLESTAVGNFTHELFAINNLMKQFPELKGIEFHLNEWGECAQGGLNMYQYPVFDYLRNSEFSALYLVKLIGSILKLRERHGLNLQMLLYWGFAGEDSSARTFAGTRSLLTYPRICKPLQTVTEMLSQVGDRVLFDSSPAGGRVGSYAFGSDDGVQVVAYNFEESRIEESYESAPLKLTVTGLEGGKYELKTVSLGRKTNNTYGAYKPLREEGHVTPETLQTVQMVNEWKPDSIREITVDGDFVLEDVLPDNEVRFYLLKKIEM